MYLYFLHDWAIRLGLAVAFIAAGAFILCTGEAAKGEDSVNVGSATAVAPEFSGGSQRWPDVAWGKDIYLVVWQEGDAYDGAPDANIMAARISPEGKTLDPNGIVVCTAKHHQIYPKVAFDGENFVVAWQDYRSEKDWDVYAARVSREGKVLDADGFPLADGPGNQVHPALASDGTRMLAVWSDLRPNPGGVERYVLAGAFIKNGQPEKRRGSVLSKNGQAGSLLGAIAGWDGESFLVAAQKHPAGWEHGGPWLIRVNQDGKVEDVKFDFFGETYALACDAKGGRSFLWSHKRVGHGSYNSVFQSAVWPAGQRHLVLGLPPHYAPLNGLWAAAVYDGKNFLVVTERGLDLAEEEGRVEIDLVAIRVDPESGKPRDAGSCPYSGGYAERAEAYMTARREAFQRQPAGVVVAGEPNVFERHPALASSGDGQSLLVYSRHAGPGKVKIMCVQICNGKPR